MVRIPVLSPVILRMNKTHQIIVNPLTNKGISQPAISNKDIISPFSRNGYHCCIKQSKNKKFNKKATRI